MNNDFAHPHDVSLLLRAHGEQMWLTSEVVPVLDDLEPPSALPEDQLGAAFAYLEALSIDAARRAAETEAAYAAMVASADAGGRSFRAEARRYYAAVRALRASLGLRIARLLRTQTPAWSAHQHAAL